VRARYLETGAIPGNRRAHGRLRRGASGAFHRHGGDRALRGRARGDGAARAAHFPADVHRLGSQGSLTMKIRKRRAIIDPNLRADAASELKLVQRRLFLKGSLSLGGLALLSGCKIDDAESVQNILRGISRWNDK